MARKHYHVLRSTCGYMPDTNDVYRTKRAAEESARWWKGIDSEDLRDGERIIGNARKGGYLIVSDDPYHLTRMIEVCDCTQDCDLDAEY